MAERFRAGDRVRKGEHTATVLAARRAPSQVTILTVERDDGLTDLWESSMAEYIPCDKACSFTCPLTCEGPGDPDHESQAERTARFASAGHGGETGNLAWTYWCPPEGTHIIDPSELHVGTVRTDEDGMAHPLFVFAIVPSIPVDHGLSQNEVAARLICDALAWGPWNVKDGPAAWLHAHGFHHPFPDEGAALGTEDVQEGGR